MTVVVNDEFSAKQTGANKITVTGSDLSDKLEDYTLTLGTAKKTLKTVVLNEAKTEAVLTTATSTLATGTYKVTFGEKAAEFNGEEAKVANIVIEPEYAILDASSNKKAFAYYKVFNQFDEDVTSQSLGSADINVTGTDVSEWSKGKVTFDRGASGNDYNMNVSQVSLSIISKTNGVSVSKVLTVADSSKLSEVEFVGVYKSESGKYTKVETINEGLTKTDLGSYYLLFTGVDQYGLTYTGINSKNLSVTLSSATGLSTVSEFEANLLEIDGVQYAALKLTANGDKGIMSGDVSMMCVVLTSGKTATASIAVGAVAKIDSIKVYATNGIYAGVRNELDFEVLDTEGKQITSIDELSILNSNYIKDNDIRFVGTAKGGAKLIYDCTDPKYANGLTTSLSWITPTNKFGYTTLTVKAQQYPKAIIGIKAGYDDAQVAATSGNSIVIKGKQFIYEDQYGNVMSSDALGNNNSKYQVKVVTSASVATSQMAVTPGQVGVNSDALAVTFAAVSAPATTSLKMKAQLVDITKNPGEQVVSGSDYDFYLYAVALNDVSGVSASTSSVLHANQDTVAANLKVKVSGYYGSNIIKLVEDTDFTRITKATAPAIDVTVDGYKTKEATATFVLNNNAGTELNVTYKYSNEAEKVASSDAYSWDAPSTGLAANGYLKYTKNQPVTVASMAAATYTKTNYNTDNKNVAGSTQLATTLKQPRITYTNLPTGKYTLTNNGTDSASLVFTAEGWYTLHVKYNFNDGFVYETDIVFNVE